MELLLSLLLWSLQICAAMCGGGSGEKGHAVADKLLELWSRGLQFDMDFGGLGNEPNEEQKTRLISLDRIILRFFKAPSAADVNFNTFEGIDKQVGWMVVAKKFGLPNEEAVAKTKEVVDHSDNYWFVIEEYLVEEPKVISKDELEELMVSKVVKVLASNSPHFKGFKDETGLVAKMMKKTDHMDDEEIKRYLGTFINFLSGIPSSSLLG